MRAPTQPARAAAWPSASSARRNAPVIAASAGADRTSSCARPGGIASRKIGRTDPSQPASCRPPPRRTWLHAPGAMLSASAAATISDIGSPRTSSRTLAGCWMGPHADTHRRRTSTARGPRARSPRPPRTPAISSPSNSSRSGRSTSGVWAVALQLDGDRPAPARQSCSDRDVARLDGVVHRAAPCRGWSGPIGSRGFPSVRS
jgi:hypothetical protein